MNQYIKSDGIFASFFVTFITGLALASFSILSFSCAEPSFSSETQSEMEKAVSETISAEDIPGVIAGVWIPGEGEWVEAAGEADIETKEKIRSSDRVRIASNTKPFTATVILQLAEEGKLSLDDKLEEYVPGFQYGDEITIRQVCNMTGGIYSFTEDEGFQSDFENDPLMEITPQQEVDIAMKHEPYFPPGEGWYYSDTDYIILGMIIEEVTGNEASYEITERIIKPLGLKNTSLPDSPEIYGDHSRGYVYKGDQLDDFTNLNPSVAWTAGGMISNLQDMRVWARALAEGELLSDEMHAEQLTWVDTGTSSMKYGLGVVNIDGFIGHHGAIFGYNSIFLYQPAKKATIVIFANKSTNDSGEASDICMRLMKILFPECISR